MRENKDALKKVQNRLLQLGSSLTLQQATEQLNKVVGFLVAVTYKLTLQCHSGGRGGKYSEGEALQTGGEHPGLSNLQLRLDATLAFWCPVFCDLHKGEIFL